MTKRFSGLRSLWMIFAEWRKWTAHNTLYKMLLNSFSVKLIWLTRVRRLYFEAVVTMNNYYNLASATSSGPLNTVIYLGKKGGRHCF